MTCTVVGRAKRRKERNERCFVCSFFCILPSTIDFDTQIIIVMTPPTSATASKKGIDIQEALSILSARAKTGEDVSNSNSVPDELKGRGQTISIADELEFTNPANLMKCDCGPRSGEDDDTSENKVGEDAVEDGKHEAMKQERIRRAAEIKSKVRSMCVSDLLGMIFGAQQERVVTYKIYEE